MAGIERIIWGALSGADRAALEFAIDRVRRGRRSITKTSRFQSVARRFWATPWKTVTVAAAKVTLCEALQAADALKSEGVGITVIDAYSIKPLTKDAIKAAALYSLTWLSDAKSSPVVRSLNFQSFGTHPLPGM